MNRKLARLKRATKAREIIKTLGVDRLSVYRTPKHIYAQITTADGSQVLACSSTLESSIKSKLSNTGNVEAAKQVGKCIAERAISSGIQKVAFDRSGFKYHGRIKALADAAREAGLIF